MFFRKILLVALLITPLASGATAQPARRPAMSGDEPVEAGRCPEAVPRLKKEEAEREAAAFKQASERARQMTQNVQTGVLGPQKAEP